MIWWTGLAPWEFEWPFPGSRIATFLEDERLNWVKLRRDHPPPTWPGVSRRGGHLLRSECFQWQGLMDFGAKLDSIVAFGDRRNPPDDQLRLHRQEPYFIDNLLVRIHLHRQEGLAFHCRTISASTAPCTSGRTCYPYAHVLVTVLRLHGKSRLAHEGLHFCERPPGRLVPNTRHRNQQEPP